MKVLVTGAFGNLGLMLIRELESRGIQVRCTDLAHARSRRAARAHAGRVEIAWGDIRNADWLAQQVEDVDAVVHLAGLLPPITEQQPALAEAVNVTATQQLVDALARSPRRPLLVYPSSLTVFGMTQSRPPPRTASDPVTATDVYTAHKLAVERCLAASSIAWVVFRIGVSVDSRTLSADAGTLRQLIGVRADNRLEWVHPEDVALAMASAVQTKDSVAGRVLLIGGGPRCQVTQSAFLGTAIAAAGLRWREDFHGHDEYYTDWLDTAESQQLLGYQRHGFDDYRREMARRLRWVRWLLWPLRPILNRLLVVYTRRLKIAAGAPAARTV